jgi:hypothetical protein
MNQSEKEMILVKLQELTTIIQGITCKEATLFDHEEENPILQPVQEQETIPTEEKPRKTRVRLKDGTMTAATIAHHLSKELGRTITRESVVRVGKQIKAKLTYCERQHISRYTPESVTTIMNLYRSFNQL